jgi:hypothetical protein
MKQKIALATLPLILCLLFPQFSQAQNTSNDGDNVITQEWSFYMDHVIHLLDYVEATASLREIFDDEIKSRVDLFEKKQRTMDFIATTQEYLQFLEKAHAKLTQKQADPAYQKEVEQIQALNEPSLESVRANLVVATQTKLFFDKMIADKSGWAYDKSRLVFKSNTIQEQYASLQKKLMTLDQPVLDPSMLTQRETTR